MSDQSPGTGGDTGLGGFLRSHRARITPEEAGLPTPSGTRRVPGLRREEVAQLAGVSVDYYVRMERGRNLNVSKGVLDALARVLRLDRTERQRLFALARPTSTRRRPLPPQRVGPGLQRLLETLTETPAMILGRRLDILATNSLARALHIDFDALPARERNMARYVFFDEAARELYVDWPTAARSIVAGLHLYVARHPDDPQLAELIGELSLHDKDFRRWWAEHDRHRHIQGMRRYHHPLVGELTMDLEALTPMNDPDQLLALYTTEPGSPSRHALHLLASWTSQPESSDEPGSADPRQ